MLGPDCCSRAEASSKLKKTVRELLASYSRIVRELIVKRNNKVDTGSFYYSMSKILIANIHVEGLIFTFNGLVLGDHSMARLRGWTD